MDTPGCVESHAQEEVGDNGDRKLHYWDATLLPKGVRN